MSTVSLELPQFFLIPLIASRKRSTEFGSLTGHAVVGEIVWSNSIG